MIIAVLLLFASTLVEAQIAVGPLAARAGEIASGTIDVPAAADAGSQIPVTLVAGASPGPTLALVAGMHGYEYTPILAMQRLRASINPRVMRGNLIIVHVANMPSFFGRTIYFSPADRKNLNRVFPGTPKGTTSERIA